MGLNQLLEKKIKRDIALSIFIYILPVAAVYFYFISKGQTPWLASVHAPAIIAVPSILKFIEPALKIIQSWGSVLFVVALAVIEFVFGLYTNKWSKAERALDIICFILPKFLLIPAVALFSLKFLPFALHGFKDYFSWVPFWGGLFIIIVATDLSQYWYHRLHHQLPQLWRFHRTHHSAQYMSVLVNSRQNFFYILFLSQLYITATLIYLGLAFPALVFNAFQSIWSFAYHSSVKWDKPLYKYKVLHPVAYVLERLLVLPATHHAHHADTTGDGIGNYKGNFGGLFFIWDVLFGTALISRKYPTSYGIKQYRNEEWYAQILWPVIKSKKQGSELSKNGPIVADEVEYGFSAEKIVTGNNWEIENAVISEVLKS